MRPWNYRHSGVAIIVFAFICLLSCAKPMARFNYAAAPNQVAPVIISFKNNSENAVRYHWDFGDGTTSDEANPSHLFKASGNYAVVLEAQDAKGKINRKEERILISPPKSCTVEIETEFGSMFVELSDLTPQHRDNFIKLADENYYDGLLFHRVMRNFMVQGGDPQSKHAQAGQRLGTGGPNYTIPREFNPALVHTKGALAAARTPDNVNPEKASSGSQFYIVQGRKYNEKSLQQAENLNGMQYTKAQKEAYYKYGGTAQLDGNYTVFGQVIFGMPIIDSIAAQQVDGAHRPLEDIRMKMRVVH